MTRGWTEFLSAIYSLFIPYLYISASVGMLGRPRREWQRFLNGFSGLYAISMLGYVFMPAHGPIVFLDAGFPKPLSGGYFLDLVTIGTAVSGGEHGAFPSLHVGASVFICLFDLESNRLRGLIYLPVVILILLSTIGLRYHYAFDVIVGASLGMAAFAMVSEWPLQLRAFENRRPWMMIKGLFWESVVRGIYFRSFEATGTENLDGDAPVILVASRPLTSLDRRALQCATTSGFTLAKNAGHAAVLIREGAAGSRIVPVGIHYANGARFRSAAWVYFGECLHAESLLSLSAGDIERRIGAASDEVSSRLEEPGRAEIMAAARDLIACENRESAPLDQIEYPVRQKLVLLNLIARMAPHIEKNHASRLMVLVHKIGAYTKKLQQLGVSPEEISTDPNWGRYLFVAVRELEILIIGIPMALWGIVNNAFPMTITQLFAREEYSWAAPPPARLVKRASLIFPLCYAVQIGLACLLLEPGNAMLYAISLPLGGMTAILYRERAGGALRRMRTFRLFGKQPMLQASLLEERQSLVASMFRLAAQPVPSSSFFR